MMRPVYRKTRFRRKAERPLLLLFPGCCDDVTASAMRIRKLRGLPGNAAAAAFEQGDSTSSAALADESHLLPAAPTAATPALQDRPYMNLDEFVSSLAQKNCFPDEERHDKTVESSGSLINFFDDQSVDTCLRLAINPDPVRIKGGHVVDDDGRLQYGSTTTHARIESPSEAEKSTVPEVFGENHQSPTSIPEPEEVEGEDGQPEQTPKSSTESMERRPRRTSRSTGRKREWSAEEEEEEEEEEEDVSSEDSTQRNKTRKRKRKKSEHSSVTQDHTTSSEKKAKTGGKQKKPGSGSRSGRPKKLKYMKQENTEELGNQCNRSDGKGWTCPLLAKTGYQLCDHHLDKLRCKPGSRSKYNKSKKKNQQQQGAAAASTLS